MLAVGGLAVMVVAAFAGLVEAADAGLTVVGTMMLATGHLFNWHTADAR